MKRIISLFILSCCLFSLYAQPPSSQKQIEDSLRTFFKNYTTTYANIGVSQLESIELDYNTHSLYIYTNPQFGYQPFTNETVSGIYRSVKQQLPEPFNDYRITIIADGKPIQELVPNALQKKSKQDKSRLWNGMDYQGDAWVKNISRPYESPLGLEGRHIAVHQSHGKFFKNEKGEWQWQRPRLFCTTEDLFTQSFVVPYIIPMLEHAGAVVFTARERDWQPNEVIVDNDTQSANSVYIEQKNRRSKWQTASIKGFAQLQPTYTEGNNPFTDGTTRFVPTSSKKRRQTFAQWIPAIPKTGSYAVYVSYPTLKESVTDAKYIVFHKGGETEFRVNQQMGGGTWVYLGTFDFEQGSHDYGMVVLSNESKQKGVVGADAVRFGGGMGNIARSASVDHPTITSGLPRYLEGARYNAQWSGMPYHVYSGRAGTNDYADDINTRSNMVNHLSGGSVFNPTQKGLGVPFELSISVHSDAGFSKNDSELIGSLGIYTTDFNEGKLGGGISRYASRDLNQQVLTGLKRDLSATFGIDWVQRGMWNRNYSESRVPTAPSMILETLSHQNFADMKLGHDPHFKFTLGRSVYKSILKYVASMHERDYVVQPLPVEQFAIRLEKKKYARLTWQPVADPLEATATADAYIVYTRIGQGGFDNGVLVKDNTLLKELEPGVIYSFKVCAVNKGGESFPSEILSTCYVPHSKGTVLIINGFNRLSGPETIQTTNLQGFNLRQDIGVPYLRTPEYCGNQLYFDRTQAGIETEGGLGFSGSELEGHLIAGNTFDYPYIHGLAIQSAGGYSFVSCSDEAVESGQVDPTHYKVVDYILGVEKAPFTPPVQHWITRYCQQGGRLLISGSFVNDAQAAPFMANILKFTDAGNMLYSSANEVMGTGIRFAIHRAPNEVCYALPSPASILPVAPAFSSFAYTDGNRGAGIAYKDSYRTFVLGFPLECVVEANVRAHIMKGVLGFFE